MSDFLEILTHLEEARKILLKETITNINEQNTLKDRYEEGFNLFKGKLLQNSTVSNIPLLTSATTTPNAASSKKTPLNKVSSNKAATKKTPTQKLRTLLNSEYLLLKAIYHNGKAYTDVPNTTNIILGQSSTNNQNTLLRHIRKVLHEFDDKCDIRQQSEKSRESDNTYYKLAQSASNNAIVKNVLSDITYASYQGYCNYNTTSTPVTTTVVTTIKNNKRKNSVKKPTDYQVNLENNIKNAVPYSSNYKELFNNINVRSSGPMYNTAKNVIRKFNLTFASGLLTNSYGSTTSNNKGPHATI